MGRQSFILVVPPPTPCPPFPGLPIWKNIAVSGWERSVKIIFLDWDMSSITKLLGAGVDKQ